MKELLTLAEGYRHLGRCLRQSRARTGLTRADVAARLGIKEGTVAAYERGARSFAEVPEHIYRLAHLYKWNDGAVEAVLCGDTPTFRREPDDSRSDVSVRALTRLIQIISTEPSFTDDERHFFVAKLIERDQA